jgi:hypothetical protein
MAATSIGILAFPSVTQLDLTGPGQQGLMDDVETLDFLRRQATGAKWLMIEYDPDPPFGAGSATSAAAARLEEETR